MSYDREALMRQIEELLAPSFSGDITLHCLNGQVESIGVSVKLRSSRTVVWTWHEEETEKQQAS